MKIQAFLNQNANSPKNSTSDSTLHPKLAPQSCRAAQSSADKFLTLKLLTRWILLPDFLIERRCTGDFLMAPQFRCLEP